MLSHCHFPAGGEQEARLRPPIPSHFPRIIVSSLIPIVNLLQEHQIIRPFTHSTPPAMTELLPQISVSTSQSTISNAFNRVLTHSPDTKRFADLSQLIRTLNWTNNSPHAVSFAQQHIVAVCAEYRISPFFRTNRLTPLFSYCHSIALGNHSFALISPLTDSWPPLLGPVADDS